MGASASGRRGNGKSVRCDEVLERWPWPTLASLLVGLAPARPRRGRGVGPQRARAAPPTGCSSPTWGAPPSPRPPRRRAPASTSAPASLRSVAAASAWCPRAPAPRPAPTSPSPRSPRRGPSVAVDGERRHQRCVVHLDLGAGRPAGHAWLRPGGAHGPRRRLAPRSTPPTLRYDWQLVDLATGSSDPGRPRDPGRVRRRPR